MGLLIFRRQPLFTRLIESAPKVTFTVARLHAAGRLLHAHYHHALPTGVVWLFTPSQRVVPAVETECYDNTQPLRGERQRPEFAEKLVAGGKSHVADEELIENGVPRS